MHAVAVWKVPIATLIFLLDKNNVKKGKAFRYLSNKNEPVIKER